MTTPADENDSTDVLPGYRSAEAVLHASVANLFLIGTVATEWVGADSALWLLQHQDSAEVAGDSLFVIKHGLIDAPVLSEGARHVTTGNRVFATCQARGLELAKKRLTRDDVDICDEADFIEMAPGVTPFREIDCLAIGRGSRDRLTDRIQAAFFGIVTERIANYARRSTRVCVRTRIALQQRTYRLHSTSGCSSASTESIDRAARLFSQADIGRRLRRRR